MNSTIIFFILIAAIFVVLLFITILLFLRNQSLKKELTQNKDELNSCYANLDELHPQLEQARICAEKLKTENKLLSERLEQQKVEFAKQEQKNAQFLDSTFRNMATEFINRGAQALQNQSTTAVANILAPLNQSIESFKKEVAINNNTAIQHNSMLSTKIELLNSAQIKLSSEANKLTEALTGNSKTIGCWGEVILEKVLESAGIKEHVVFERELVLKNADNKIYRPDAVITLPGNQQLIIDSKCPLSAYARYSDALNENNQEVIESELKTHIKNIENRITELADKKYYELVGLNSPEFVFLFIPIENAYTVAFAHKPELLDFAAQRNIAITTPSTLLASMFIVKELFALEKRSQNLDEAVRTISSFTDKISKLYERFQTLENNISHVQKSYNEVNNTFAGRNGLLESSKKIREKLNL